MSTFTLLATIPVGPSDLGAETEALVTFTYRPGAPATGPTYASGGDPGYAPEVEFVDAYPYCNGKPSAYYGAFADLEFANLQDVARSWLENDDGFNEACAHVAANPQGPDPDVARQARIDDEMMERGR